MSFDFKIVEKANLTASDKKLFGKFLKLQGKVHPDVNGSFDKKASRCLFVCFAFEKEKPVAIGGIKKPTKSDFSKMCANLPEKTKLFDWELGYMYTLPEYGGNGIASDLVKTLLNKYGTGNLMASTELTSQNRMQGILTKNGFKKYGRTWKSKNNLDLALLLKLED